VIITAIVRQQRRRRVTIVVDDELAAELGLDLAAELDLRPGREVTAGLLAGATREDQRRTAFDAAVRLLAYRPRSEQEVRRRLHRRGLPQPAIEETVRRLRDLGYLNDAAYARFWTESRQATRPRSARAIVRELQQQGVALEVAKDAVECVSDEETAYDAAKRRLRSLYGLEYGPFRERLGSFLTRRGFSYEVARKTVERCWAEVNAPSDSPDTGVTA
jgi:regulatory protein